jgi:hypothetical protein
MTFVVIAKLVGRKIGPIGKIAGECGTGAEDGEVSFGREADHLVEIAVDGPGVDEESFGKLAGIGKHGGALVETDAVADQLGVVVLVAPAGESGCGGW